MAWACSRRSAGIMPPWTTGKSAALGPGPGRLGARRPPQGQGRGLDHFGFRRRVARTLIQADHDVHPQGLLEAHHGLRGEEMAGAVQMRPEGHALLAHGAQGRQAEDLVAAGVGEDGAVPVHEAVQPPQGLDGRNPGPQVEVIGVAQDDAGADFVQVLRGQGLHRGVGPHRHEHRGFDHPPGRGDLPQPGPGRAGGFYETKVEHRLIYPKEAG